MLRKAHLAFNLACGLLLVALVLLIGPQLINSDSASAILLARDLMSSPGWIDSNWAYVSDSLTIDGRLQLAILGTLLMHEPLAVFLFCALAGAAFAFSASVLLSRLMGASRLNAGTAALVLLLGPSLLYIDIVVGLAVSIQIGLVLYFVAALSIHLFGRGKPFALVGALVILLVMTVSSPMKALAYLVIPTLGACVLMLAGARAGTALEPKAWRRMVAVVLATLLVAGAGIAWHRLLVDGLLVDTRYARLQVTLGFAHVWQNTGLLLRLLAGFAGSRNPIVPQLSVVAVCAAWLVFALTPLLRTSWRDLFASRQGFVYAYALIAGLAITVYLVTYQSIKPFYGIYYLLVPTASLLSVNAWSATAATPAIRRMVVSAMVLALACGAVNAVYRIAVPTAAYSGISIKQRTSHRDQQAAVEWLLSRGIERGFATYWEANTMTFLSDGRIQATPVRTPAGGRMVRRMAWLADRDRVNYAPGRERWFILLPVKQRSAKLPATCLPATSETRVAGSRIYLYDRPMPGCLQAPIRFAPRKKRTPS